MARLQWDAAGSRLYETGTDRGVLYVAKDNPTAADPYQAGVPWNGLTAVSESGSGGEPSPLWADNIKYLNLISAEECSFSIEAYTYPEEFEVCDGSRVIGATQTLANTGVVIGQQPRKMFGFCYRTIIGNDQLSNDYGYKLHLAYGCYASPSDKSYATVSDSPDAITFSWSVTTTPVEVNGFKPTALITIDSTQCPSAKLIQIENILYGTDGNGGTAARLPLPNEIITILNPNAS